MQKISLEQLQTLVKESYDYDMGKLSKDSETYRVLKDYPHLGILDLYRMCLTFNYWYVNVNCGKSKDSPQATTSISGGS